MIKDYPCGCRSSDGAWYLCERHAGRIEHFITQKPKLRPKRSPARNMCLNWRQRMDLHKEKVKNRPHGCKSGGVSSPAPAVREKWLICKLQKHGVQWAVPMVKKLIRGEKVKE